MLYLSQAIGRPVRDRQGEPIGKVADLIVALGGRYPPVTGLVVATEPAPDLPAVDVRGRRSTAAARACAPPRSTSTSSRSGPTRSCCARTSWTSRSSTSTAARWSASTTCASTRSRGRMHLVAVDVGHVGLAPPAGPRGAVPDAGAQPAAADARALHRLGGRGPGRNVHRLDPAAGPHAGPARAPSGGPRHDHRSAGADATGRASWPSLDDEAAADAIEEMEPETQVEVLEDLTPERAADILEEMSPDDAADLVADLSETARDGDPGADGARRGGRGPRAARLPGGHGRRDHDHRVHRRPGRPDGGRDHRSPARARARRGDDLLRLRHRRRRTAWWACCRCAT